MTNEIFKRSIGLLGKDNFEFMQEQKIAVFGLGGVGGTALEALVRTGFRHFIIVDFDKVELSNLNRQILYLYKDVGRYKVDVAKERLLAINPVIDVKKYCLKSQDFVIDERIDFIVDAIDDVEGKIALLVKAKENNIKSVMSLGMANRHDPNAVYLTTLNKTHTDPLAKKIRYLAKKNNLDPKEIAVVVSEELPQKNEVKLNSSMMAPSSSGLTIAKYIIEPFTERRRKSYEKHL